MNMKTKELFAVCLATAAVGTSFPLEAEPVIDDTPTRVQTDLDVPYACIGTLRPKAVGELSASRWTVDCAGYERDHIDWRNVRDYVAPLGIPRIRLQAGWARVSTFPTTSTKSPIAGGEGS